LAEKTENSDTMAQNNKRTVNFEKYHGAGNDFIMVADMEDRIRLSTEDIAALCHRRYGIGADGLIIIRPSQESDYRMHYYNSDGKESTMCGNGGRCVAAFAYSQEIAGKEQRFLGPDGIHKATILSSENGYNRVTLQLSNVVNLHQGNGYYTLDTGSPHYVAFGHNIDTLDVKSKGRKIRFSAQFAPGGLNVNFAEEKNGKLFVRTYERGVEDETLSCGTGVTAAALAFAEEKSMQKGAVRILSRGGEMQVAFEKENNIFKNILLTGPAVMAFEGSVTI